MSRERNMDTGKEIVRCDICGTQIPWHNMIHSFNIEIDFLRMRDYKETCSSCSSELAKQIDKLEGVFEVDRDGPNYTIRAYPPVGVERGDGT